MTAKHLPFIKCRTQGHLWAPSAMGAHPLSLCQQTGRSTHSPGPGARPRAPRGSCRASGPTTSRSSIDQNFPNCSVDKDVGGQRHSATSQTSRPLLWNPSLQGQEGGSTCQVSGGMRGDGTWVCTSLACVHRSFWPSV